MTSVFSNNAYSTLAASIATSTTSIVLSTGEGARFPAPTGGDYFYVTFIDTANNLEIAKCTSRVTDTLTVVRAQEGTTATAYAVGDRVEQRVTAAGLTDVITAAATSATNAATSETNAATSETNAATSETNAATSETNAATSETNAATSETNAATSETNAATSETNAATSETNAATSETNAAAYAAKMTGTSTTSVAIATGAKSFTTQTGKFFAVGQWLLITSDANGANYMHGQSTAYDTATGALTVNVVDIGGSGTLTDWTIRLSGTRGAVGATGLTGQPQWQGQWLTATAYVVNDSVYENGSSYICLVAHTSGTFATDLGNLDWGLMAKKGTGDVTGPAGATQYSLAMFADTTGNVLQDGPALGTAGQVMTSNGAGVAPAFVTPTVYLSPASNLSDVATAATSLANIGGIGAATADTLTNKTIDANSNTILNLSDSFGSQLLHVREEQVSGTGAGSSVAGVQTRVFNTVKTNEISGASLASNQVTLPAGAYYIAGSAPALLSDKHKAYLYNVTDSADTIIGTSEVNGSTIVAQTRSFVNGRFTIAATKVFEIRQYINVASATTGLGDNTDSGQIEVYAEVMIWKVG